MENGLQLPEDITLIWCDDNYGYMTRLSDKEQQKRNGVPECIIISVIGGVRMTICGYALPSRD